VRREAHRNEEATHKTLLAGVICSGRELFRKGEPQRPSKLCAICSPKSRVACARCLAPNANWCLCNARFSRILKRAEESA
jgi:hypothetical protein